MSRHVAVPPDRVFEYVTDPSQLPKWNRAIAGIVEAPPQLEVGASWKVQLHALGQSWVSVSQVSTLDPGAGRFTYRSQTDDGNPSYADWDWLVEPDGDGAKVTVTVDLNPTSFLRKYLLVRIRRPVLRKEMQESLRALEGAVMESP